jgi:hypothetical protein
MILIARVPLLISFARSGGTLLNQLLGSHPDVLILSEVNPSGSVKPLSDQAVEWLGLLKLGGKKAFEKMLFPDQIKVLQQAAEEKGKVLIIRDWSSINFVDTRTHGWRQPSGILETPAILKAAELEVDGLVVTRRYHSLRRSLRATFQEFARMPEDDLARAYLAYARAASVWPHIHLEDLQANPDVVLQKVFGQFGLSFDAIPSVLRTFSRFAKCTGNNTAQSKPSSASFAEIRRKDLEEKDERPLSPEAEEADRIFGYR